MTRLKPSPGTLIAMIALVVALAGTAYAATKIDTEDIRRGAVTKKKLADGAVTNKAIAEDAVTGDKVVESSLGQVPNAAKATTADRATNADQAAQASNAAQAGNADTVGGMRVQKFFAKPGANSPLTTIATLGTLELRGGCNAGGKVLLEVRAAAGAPSQGVRSTAVLGDDDVATQGQGTIPPAGITILDGTQPNAGADGHIEASTANGGVTTIQWGARDANNLVPSANPEPDKCFIFGTALSG